MDWLNDQETAQLLGGHLPLTLEREYEFLDPALTQTTDKGIILAIWLKDKQGRPTRLIGNVGLHNMNQRNQFAELGIFIGDKKCWSKGYGTEAMRTLVRYAFETLNLRKVTLRHFSHNARGRAAYLKVGFKEVGRYHEHLWVAGAWRDEVHMELFREEFLQPKASKPVGTKAR